MTVYIVVNAVGRALSVHMSLEDAEEEVARRRETSLGECKVETWAVKSDE